MQSSNVKATAKESGTRTLAQRRGAAGWENALSFGPWALVWTRCRAAISSSEDWLMTREAGTVESLLVSIGSPRLATLGFQVANPIPDASRRLYERLHAEDADSAHGRYNALVRRLVSFERAAAATRA